MAAAGDGDYASVVAELDRLLVQLLSEAEELRKAQAAARDAIKRGHWKLGETCFSTNPHYLGSFNYTGRLINPTRTVDVDAGFAVIEAPLSEAERAESKDGLSSVRRRFFKTPKQMREDDRRNAQKGIVEELPPTPEVDLSRQPLRWFGVLPPESLPQAAEYFATAVAALARAAKHAVAVGEMERRFVVLRARKATLSKPA